MSIRSAKFIVQRGDEQFYCRGDQLKSKLEPGDLMVVQHENEARASKWMVEGAPWESHDGGIFHIIVDDYGPLILRDPSDNVGTFTAYDVDGNEKRVSEVQQGEELIVLTPPDASFLFNKNKYQEWRFLELTNTSKVTHMGSMFRVCEYFNEPLDMFDMSGVVSAHDMFISAIRFNQPLDSWDVSNITEFNSMFTSANKFNQDISMWNTKNARNMYGMFTTAISFRGDLSQWCVPYITEEPDLFATSSPMVAKPVWGTCPRGEDQ